MYEEQIDQIMSEISLYGRLSAAFPAQDAIKSLRNIRANLEALVAGYSVTQPWHMIQDGETYMIINVNAGSVYCRGMEENDAVLLVRKLNGIEE